MRQLRIAGGTGEGLVLVLNLKQRAFMSCDNMVARDINSLIPQDTCNY